MYYPCSENKGADQLRGYREADLRLCFRLGKTPVFSRCGSFDNTMQRKSLWKQRKHSNEIEQARMITHTTFYICKTVYYF